jgi:serine phosphatase RsbU (regulator of sigma subunit)
MNSIYLIGSESLKLKPFLEKLGYIVVVESEQEKTVQILEERIVDLVVIGVNNDNESYDLVEFLRNFPPTLTTPVLVFGEEDELKAKDERIVYLKSGSIGVIAGKIAALLRLRKLDGAELNGDIVDMNLALRDYDAKIQKDLAEARLIQLSTIPESVPIISGVDISYSFSPLEELGGDWFYVQKEDDGTISTIIADVTGHGLAAAFIGGWLKLALVSANNLDPKERLAKINSLITPLMPEGRFITVSLAQYSPNSGRLRQATGGHPPSIIKKKSGEVVKLKGDGFAIGFMDSDSYVITEESLDVGDVFIMVSDGITEAMNMSSEMYGINGLINAINLCDISQSALNIQEAILANLNEFTGGRIIKDDITIVVLKRI